MKRYKIVVAYDGTRYSGFQVQPNATTIQGEIEQALTTIAKGQLIRLHGAGRTDAGVHAKGQVCHFDFPFYIPAQGMRKAINANTPSDIVVGSADLVSDGFHARYDACGKTYEYRVYTSAEVNPFKRLYAYHHPRDIDIDRVREALQFIIGEHDFTSFSAVKAEVTHRIRRIDEASVRVVGDEYVFRFSGNGFLYNMIRIIMGTVLDVSDGKRSPKDIPRIIAAKDRQAASPTASPVGLCMVEVNYDRVELDR